MVVTVAPVASGGQLLMFGAQGCAWCERWEQEIGEFYHVSSEARVFPLRRIDINARHRGDDLQRVKGIVYTPTFVVFYNEREVGRILGYPGEVFFWPMLGQLIEKATGQPLAE